MHKRASLYRHGLITIAAVALPVALSAQASATVNGTVYPDETLTATAIIFNEDDACPLYAAGPPPPCPDVDYNVDVSWQVGCNYTVTNFDLGQVVSPPTLFTWSYGYPGISGTPVQLTFMLTPQMCGGYQALGENFSLQVFTQVENSTSPAQDQVTLAYEQATP